MAELIFLLLSNINISAAVLHRQVKFSVYYQCLVSYQKMHLLALYRHASAHVNGTATLT